MALKTQFRRAVLCLSLWLVGSCMEGGYAQVAAASSDTIETPPPSAAATAADYSSSRFALHGQLTFTEQLVAPFHAPYRGANSLSDRQGAETADVTLYLGARLWSGAEVWANPEIDQGFGLNDTLGVAGFPSGEAYKVGSSHPYWRLPRLFLRQTINAGGEVAAVDEGANQFATRTATNRWVFTIGKFGVTDVFDANDYAHDPKHDFLNWTAVDVATFDYAADAWGYTAGAAAEWYQGAWTVRAGIFDLSDVPNSEVLDHGFHEFQSIAELEHRHEWSGCPGKLLLTAYDSRGRMALLADALTLAQTSGIGLNTALIDARQYRSRTGVSADFQQQLRNDLGVFVRAGSAGGKVEAYEFTDVDQSLSAGVSLKGIRWHRPNDTVGLAGIVNSISATRERYLAAGGLGILVGDGQLPHPHPERIVELYYGWQPLSWTQVTLDYQNVVNPAYNSDRGPASIVAVRVHAQF